MAHYNRRGGQTHKIGEEKLADLPPQPLPVLLDRAAKHFLVSHFYPHITTLEQAQALVDRIRLPQQGGAPKAATSPTAIRSGTQTRRSCRRCTAEFLVRKGDPKSHCSDECWHATYASRFRSVRAS